MCYLIGNVFQVSDVVSGSPRNSYSIHIIGCKVTDTSGPRATLFILAPIKGIDKLQETIIIHMEEIKHNKFKNLKDTPYTSKALLVFI